MSAVLSKKLAQQVAEIRSGPDNKRCFNCESLGTTYYVPQFSIFVCTSCSGIHMQFGHRVKSVTLADYKADEVEHMKEGGNQVAAYKYLARYTPDKDLRKPVDRNPQRVRIWIQTVFVDKRFYNADAPIPRRSQDGSGAGTPVPLASPSSSLKRELPSRESSLKSLPSPDAHSSTAASTAGVHAVLTSISSSPPVRDMRELLGNKVTAIQVGPRQHSEPVSSANTSRASSVAGMSATGTPAAAAAITPQAPAKPVAQPVSQPAFDPFAVPESFGSVPASQATTVAIPAASTAPAKAAAFDPFETPAPTPVVAAEAAPVQAGPQAAAAQAASSNGYDTFGDVPAFAARAVQSAIPAAAFPGTPSETGPSANPQVGVQTATPAAAAAANMPPAVTNTHWASFEDNAFENPAASLADSMATGTSFTTAGVAGHQTSSSADASSAAGVVIDRAEPVVKQQQAVTAAPVTATAASDPSPAPATPAPVSSAPAAAVAAPVAPSGSSKAGKPPAKELAADLFAELTYPQPVAAVLAPHPQAAAMQFQQQPRPAAMAGYQQPGMMISPQPPMQYGMMPMGYGVTQQQVPMGLQQQQQAVAWQQQQQAMAFQQQQAAMGMYPGYRPHMLQGGVPYSAMNVNGVMAGAINTGQQQQQEANPTSPSWVANTATAGVTEENAFADLVDLKKALPAVSSPQSASGAGFGYAPYPQQQQIVGMPGMLSPGMAPYGMPGGFPAASITPQPMMMQQQQHLPYGAGPGVAGVYGAGMAVAQVPGTMGATPHSASASTDSGNPFA